jgi:outer membrane autotransporter protein
MRGHERFDESASGGSTLAYRYARARKALLAGAAATAVTLAGSSGVWAQTCGALPITIPGTTFPNEIPGFASGLSAANAIGGSITAANTAFLTQSTAFVGAPANPPANSQGSGVWVRGVAGDLNISSTMAVTATETSVPGTGTGATNCASQFHTNFAGYQLGQDIARLNLDGWNIHFGTTAGFLESRGTITNGNANILNNTPLAGAFGSTTEAPFVGTYAAVTKGGFFADGLVRFDYYESTFNSPSAGLFNQTLDAHGFAVAGSTGYNYPIPNSKWFIEPSGGLIYSRDKVNPFQVANPTFGDTLFNNGLFSGTTQINDITSLIGRVGLRVGTTIETNRVVWQPFVAASVWHEFDGTVTGTYTSCPNCFFFAGAPANLSASFNQSSIGTFGQYSVGISGQVIGTGWLGFARVDYRDGPNLNGWDGVAGLRYQYTPEQVASMPVKAPAYKAPVAGPYNWTGFYIGGFGGADWGGTTIGFPGVGDAGPQVAGALAGGTIGYNWQQPGTPWVAGLEADGAWTNAVGSYQCAPLAGGPFGLGNPFLFQTTCNDSLKWIATATGRVGYSWGRALYYVKGGVAWDEETYRLTCNLGPFQGTQAGGIPVVLFQNCGNVAGGLLSGSPSVTDVRIGATAGYGIEFAFNRYWSAKGEVDWLGFGSKNLTLSDGTAISAKQSVAEAKIGINYHWGPWGP